jgi:DNA-binding helix-turn-helix protein
VIILGYNRDEICRQIRKKRKECRFTQKELASLLGINLKTYQKLENGGNVSLDVFTDTLEKLNLNIKIFTPTLSERIKQIIAEDKAYDDGESEDWDDGNETQTH